jgi:hypothetical protein
MAALGPAGIAIIGFVGVISALAAAFSVEQAIRTALRLPAAR